jgi:S-adenosylmethionine:tRNA-ribosyltransferase-isomerase (queuine synthetase)
MIGKSRKRGVAHRTRTPRLIYGSQRLLKVYNEDESYVRAIILAMNMTSTKRVTRDNITFDPKTFLIHEYITHVRMKNVICIITNSWLTLFNTEKIMKSWMKTKKSTINGKKIDILFAMQLNSVGITGTSDDGNDVLISLGVSKNATTLSMEIGHAEMAATVLQRLNHIVVGNRNF